MPTVPETFLGIPGASGLRPCARSHLKNGLVPRSSVWWNGRQLTLIIDALCSPRQWLTAKNRYSRLSYSNYSGPGKLYIQKFLDLQETNKLYKFY